MKKYLLVFLVILANIATMMAIDINVEGVKYYVYPSSGRASAGCAYVANAVIKDSISYQDPKTWITARYPVTEIVDEAFNGNDSLETIIIGICIERINRKAFYNCENLKTVTIGNNVKFIGKEAFAWCSNLVQINTPSSIEDIADDAFYNCHKLPTYNNIRYADKFLVEAANKRTSPYSISANTTIKQDTRWIGKEAFSGSVLFNNPTLVIPDSVEIIGESAFQGGDYESVTIGEKVKQIGKWAFVGRVSPGANGTPYLKTFRLKAITPPKIADAITGTYQPIFESPAIPEIYVPCGTLETYLNSMWGKIKSYGNQKVMYRPYDLEYDYNSDEGYVNVIGHKIPNECEPELIIEAIAREGYKFDKWWDGNEENPRTIIFDEGWDGIIIIRPIFKLISDGLEDIQIEGYSPHKIIVDGQIYILRGDKVYSVIGAQTE